MSFPEDSILRRVVVQVRREEAVIGSGCIVPSSRKNGVFYCLTAKHCVEKGNIKLFVLSDNGEAEQIEYDNIIMDEQHDAAIMRVYYSAEKYPKEVYIGRFNSLYSDTMLVGYPSLRKGVISCYGVSVGHSDLVSRGAFYVNLKDIHTFTAELREQVQGISGGGCFSLDGSRDYKLLGIETCFVDEQQSFGEIVCLDVRVFEELLQQNECTELERPRYLYSSLPWRNGCNVQDKQAEYDDYDTWIDTVASSSLIPEIQGHLMSQESVEPLLLCGFSGIGKTRTALQACTRNDELSNALIFDSYDDYSEAFQSGLRNYLQKTGEEPVYIIVDNIKIDDWYDLKASIKPYKNVHVIAIAEMGMEEKRADLPMLRMEPCKEEDVVRIIQKSHPSLDKEDLHAIFFLSDNDLRFALLIAYAYERASDRIEWNIREMASNSTSAKRIVDRIMYQVEDLSSNNAVKIFSLFVDFGCQNTARGELEFLSKYFHLNELLLERMIKTCINHRLGIRKGYYFELSPRALARFLFSEYFSTLISDFSDFMEQIPTQELRIRFFERAKECGDATWEEVKGALAPWFRNKYGKTRWEVSPRLDGRSAARLALGEDDYFPIGEAMTYVEFVPEEGLQWLKSLIGSAGDNILDAFSGYRCGRREIVWTCEHLACFQESFEICEELLFRLGLHETEQAISNNSRGVWSDLFGLIQSNTEVPFDNRFRILVLRMRNYHDEWDPSMFGRALGSALLWGGTRMLPPKMIGGRLTPENWTEKNIHSLSDLVNAHRFLLSHLRENSNAFPPVMKQVAFQQLKTAMRSYTAPLISNNVPVLLEEYRQTIEQFSVTPDNRVEMIVEIDNQISFFKKRQEKSHERAEEESNQYRFLKQWRDSFTEIDFISRLKVLLSNNIYSSQEEMLPEIAKAAQELLELERPEATIEELLSVHTWNEYTFGCFAEKIGEADVEYQLRPTAQKMFGNGQNTFSMDYFRGICNREKRFPTFLQQMLDACIDCNPIGVLHMSISSDISDTGLQRIFALLDHGTSDNSVLWLTDRRWENIISLEQAEHILSRLATNETLNSSYSFFHIGKEWSKVFHQPEFLEFLFSQTKQISYAALRHYSFEFIPLLELMPEKLLLDSLILAIRSVDYKSVRGIPTEHYNYIKKYSHGIYSKEIANEICNCILVSSEDFMYGISYSSMVQLLSNSSVLEWIDVDEKKRARIIAYHLPSPSLEEVSVPEITLAVLEKYGDEENVFQRFLSGIHAYEVYSIDEVVQKWGKTRVLLEQYSSHPANSIRQWAEFEMSRIERILAQKQDMDAEDSRFQE